MAVYRCPITPPGFQWEDSAGLPLANGFLLTYLAGTTVPATTFSDATGATPNPIPTGNPFPNQGGIQLSADGRLPNIDVWLSGGTAYNFVLWDQFGVPIAAVDNIEGVNDPAFASSVVSVSEWIAFASGVVWISSNATAGTQFSTPGDVTPIVTLGRRVKLTDAGGDHFGTVVSSVFALGSTTLIALMDSNGTVANSLSTGYYSVLTADHPSIPTAPARGFGLADGNVTLHRGTPRQLTMTPSAPRVVTLDSSFVAGDRFAFVNLGATANTITLKANDATTIAVVRGGFSHETCAYSDAPTTNTSWGPPSTLIPSFEAGQEFLPVTADPQVFPPAGYVKLWGNVNDGFAGAKEALRFLFSSGGVLAVSNAAAKVVAPVAVDATATYVSGTGTAGADNTAQTVKSVSLKANSLNAVGRGIRISILVNRSAAVAITMGLKLSGTDILVGAFAVVGQSIVECELKYIDATHINAKTKEFSSAAVVTLFTANVLVPNLTGDLTLDVTQSAAVGCHLTVFEIFVEQLG